MDRHLELVKFCDLELSDPFFDSLKANYDEFPGWVAGKGEENLFIVTDGEVLSGMIYLKQEVGPIMDVVPVLPAIDWLKVGTLKVVAKGTKLGERIIKKIFDVALTGGSEGIYVTIFYIHEELINLFKKFGFYEHGVKRTVDGEELVLVKNMKNVSGDYLKDYPLFNSSFSNAWLLAIYPEYHTQLLPDSILTNEQSEIVKDVSHTNTIEKIYIGKTPLIRMSPGEPVILYRTTDHKAPAFYRSVATSVCIVLEAKRRKDFFSVDEFVEYCSPHSVFSKEQLSVKFESENRLYVVKFLYNAAFESRITRGRLLEEVGISEQPRWDLIQITKEQCIEILRIGNVNDRLIID